MDPICTLVFACIVLFTTLSVLKDTVRILVEGSPKNIEYDRVKDDLCSVSSILYVFSSAKGILF